MNDRLEVGARVPFGERLEDLVVHGLHGARYERAAGFNEHWQRVLVLQQVLDLDRHVEGDVREFAPEAGKHRGGVADAVEEIRVAERDMPRARGNLRAYVGHHDLHGDDAEAAVVDRNDRTVTAAMLAAAAG